MIGVPGHGGLSQVSGRDEIASNNARKLEDCKADQLDMSPARFRMDATCESTSGCCSCGRLPLYVQGCSARCRAILAMSLPDACRSESGDECRLAFRSRKAAICAGVI